MTGIFLLLSSLLYLSVAISYALNGNSGMGLTFLCYALANVGIYYGAK